MSVETWCGALLLDADKFRCALRVFVDGKCGDKVDNREQSVKGVQLLIDFVLDMLRDAGLCAHHRVYTTLKHKSTPALHTADGWHTCAFSALKSHRCLRVDDETTVHEDYRRWMLSVWLVTHMQELEQQRRRVCASRDIPSADVELYRTALIFVLEQLHELYASVQRRKQAMS